jgi:hypothetical protein
VTIREFRTTGRKVTDREFGEVDEVVPMTFKEADALRATISATGKNEFNFTLTSVKQ